MRQAFGRRARRILLLIVILLCKPNGLFGEKLTEKV